MAARPQARFRRHRPVTKIVDRATEIPLLSISLIRAGDPAPPGSTRRACATQARLRPRRDRTGLRTFRHVLLESLSFRPPSWPATTAANPCLDCARAVRTSGSRSIAASWRARTAARCPWNWSPSSAAARLHERHGNGRRRCISLRGELGKPGIHCAIYENRPTPCREFDIWLPDGTPNPDCQRLRLALACRRCRRARRGKRSAWPAAAASRPARRRLSHSATTCRPARRRAARRCASTRGSCTGWPERQARRQADERRHAAGTRARDDAAAASPERIWIV